MNSNSILDAILLGILILGLLITSLMYLYQRKQFKRILEINRIDTLLLKEELNSAHNLLMAQDKEINGVFSEVHNTLGSILVALNMYADSLITRSKPDQLKVISEKISDSSRQANDMVRKISIALDCGLIKHFALEIGLKNLAEAVQKSMGIQVKLEIQISDEVYNELACDVYRIVQELFSNSLKYSKCSKVDLDVQSNRGITIIYEDNGVGFDQKIEHPGNGLRNIEKQVEKLNGEFKIDSMPKRGSTFIIELPVK
ncbi:MAG: ATP-binding protein [Cyclobacteriaceae bacterium]